MDDFTRQYNIDDIIPFRIYDIRPGRALVVIFIRFSVATGAAAVLSSVYCCEKNRQNSAQRMIVRGVAVVGGVQLDVAPTACTGGGGAHTPIYHVMETANGKWKQIKHCVASVLGGCWPPLLFVEQRELTLVAAVFSFTTRVGKEEVKSGGGWLAWR